MKELSLFSGAGGGLLGTKLLGWETIGYVEFNDYCQRVIRQRIIDGILDNAPIFSDIRTFVSSGCAELYRGVTDVVTAGFPCQPFSVAGGMDAAEDDRNMWPETITVIRIVRPPLVFLENVPGLLSSGYGFTVTGDLQRAGYQVLPPLQLGAYDVGCDHKRNRIWIIAADANGDGLSRLQMQFARGKKHSIHAAKSLSLPKRQGGSGALANFPRMDDEMANRVDRIKAIGNGQVPAVVRAAWHLLTEDLP